MDADQRHYNETASPALRGYCMVISNSRSMSLPKRFSATMTGKP
jgi:hypothetical protein